MDTNNDYNGWVGLGSKDSAYCTWNVPLWIDNEYEVYSMRCAWLESLAATPTADQVKDFCTDVYPNGTPDMKAGDMAKVNWQEIADVWADEWHELKEAQS